MANRPNSRATAGLPRRAALCISLGLPLGAACSLALDLDPAQPCANDGQCVYTSGPGRCVDGLCQPGEGDGSTTSVDSTGPDLTTTGDPTADETTLDPTGNTTGPIGCSANSECPLEQRCSAEQVCVDLLSAECPIVVWPDNGNTRDDVEFLGSIMPTSPPFDELVLPLQNAHQLAINDFNDHASLQGGEKIAWVGCDSTGGADVAVTAATHLRDAVGVPAIVGPVFSEAVRAVAEQVAVPSDIFLISPTASAPSLSNFDDDNLLWRVTPADIYQGNAIIDRFTGDLGIDPSASRVLVLNKDDAYGNELRDVIGADLTSYFDHIHFASYAGPETFGSQDSLLSAYAEVLAQALVQPGVTSAAAYTNPEDHYTHILILGTSEAEAFVLSYLGLWAQQYFSQNMMIPLPLITVSHGAVPTMEQMVGNVGVTPGTEGLAPFRPLLFQNMRGTSPNIFDPDNFDAFNFRYQILFPGEEALTSSSLSYDAAMAAMFAMITVPAGDDITGTAIANGMASLNDPRGVPISFGDLVGVFVQDAHNALAAGGTVDLQGVSGALNWDPSNGEIRANVLGWNLNGSDAMPNLNPFCLYALDPEPATTGTWVSATTGMPPCG